MTDQRHSDGHRIGAVARPVDSDEENHEPGLYPRNGSEAERRGGSRGRARLGWTGFGGQEGIAVLLGFFLAWELLARSGIFSAVLLPPASAVLFTLGESVADGTVLGHAWASIRRLLVGFLIGCPSGVIIGILAGRSSRAERAIMPMVHAMFPIPGIALLPVFLLWFGLGETVTIAIVVFATILPSILNTWTGVRTIDPILVSAARSMCLGRLSMLRDVFIPGSIPMVITGMRIAVARSWRALVAAEMLSATGAGLGFMIFRARSYLQSELMFAGVIVIAVVGILTEKIFFEQLERRTSARWGLSQTADRV